jgi:proline dehydrogenase
MLRSFLIYLSKASWAQYLVSGSGIGWRAASRFVAGTTIEDAIRVSKELNAKGINVTLDHLGEHTNTPAEASEATVHMLKALDEITKADLCANLSIKLTQIGLGLDEGACRRNLERVVQRAKARNNFVRIDMEDTPYTDQTIGLFQQMRKLGYRNVGVVLQSYLFRTEADARKLAALKAPIRLVKGAYKEPPDRAFPKKADADANFDLVGKILMDAAKTSGRRQSSVDGCHPPPVAIATHDEKRIEFALRYAKKIDLPRDAVEFQMLYGIRRDLQDQLSRDGHLVRVYVPFGTHWYPYYMRRLAERPANMWFFASNLFRR